MSKQLAKTEYTHRLHVWSAAAFFLMAGAAAGCAQSTDSMDVQSNLQQFVQDFALQMLAAYLF